MAIIKCLQSKLLWEEITREERVRKYLLALRRHSHETHTHSLRVGLLSVDLGYENAIAGIELRHLGYGGLLHDVGKLCVSTEILAKPEKLNDEELSYIKGHPRLGFLELQDFGYETVRQIVVAHHEFKKGPYPRTGNDRRREEREPRDRRGFNKIVSTAAQIIAIADIYDALANRRSYKNLLGSTEIERNLREQFTGDARYLEQILARF